MNSYKRNKAGTLPDSDPVKDVSRSKDTIFYTQLKATEIFFSDEPKTMLQVAIQSGILRANICRYVANLRKHDKIHLVKTGICPISKYRSGFYSTCEGGLNDE